MPSLSKRHLGRLHSISKDDLWGIERRSDTPERMIFIYEALVKLNLPDDFSIVDIAAGRGVVLNGLAGIFPKCRPSLVDIIEYPYDWAKLRRQVKIYIMPLQEFIKKNGNYDVVLMLNSYRNWKEDFTGKVREEFDKWLVDHVKYFITSGADLPYEQGDIRGWDYKGKLQLFQLPLFNNK